MKYCTHCGSTLLPNAKFCHDCGTEVAPARTTICEACAHTNPAQAKFCVACGHQLGQIPQKNTPPPASNPAQFKLDFGDWTTFPTQIKNHFLDFLAHNLVRDGEKKKINQYLDAFERSGFRQECFEDTAISLTQYAEQLIDSQPLTAVYDIDAALYRRFEQDYLRFLSGYAANLTPAPLHSDVYMHEQRQVTHRPTLISAYLALHQERDITAYRSLLEIPLPKLKNAQTAFFYGTRPAEFPLVFIDQTVWGSGEAGLILTEDALYWKTTFHSAARVAYADIKTLVRENNYLEINSIYLSVSPSVNYKLLKLLQKLQKITQ